MRRIPNSTVGTVGTALQGGSASPTTTLLLSIAFLAIACQGERSAGEPLGRKESKITLKGLSMTTSGGGTSLAAVSVEEIRQRLRTVPTAFSDLPRSESFVLDKWQQSDLGDGSRRWISKVDLFTYEIREEKNGVTVSLMSGLAVDDQTHNGVALLRMAYLMAGLVPSANAEDRAQVPAMLTKAITEPPHVVQWSARAADFKITARDAMFVFAVSVH